MEYLKSCLNFTLVPCLEKYQGMFSKPYNALLELVVQVKCKF